MECRGLAIRYPSDARGRGEGSKARSCQREGSSGVRIRRQRLWWSWDRTNVWRGVSFPPGMRRSRGVVNVWSLPLVTIGPEGINSLRVPWRMYISVATKAGRAFRQLKMNTTNEGSSLIGMKAEMGQGGALFHGGRRLSQQGHNRLLLHRAITTPTVTDVRHFSCRIVYHLPVIT